MCFYTVYIGTYLDGTLAVWSTCDYSLLSATALHHHTVHQAAWDPLTAYELATVGTGLKFWLVEEDKTRNWALKVTTRMHPRVFQSVTQYI